MSASDDIWILGISMTKFGKHPDLDAVDLGSEAIMAALADAGVTMADIGIMAAGNLVGGGGIAQRLQKQVGQTGIPAYNVSNACATGATALRTAIMAVKAGEVEMGLAVGVEKLAGAGLLAGSNRADDGDEWTPSGRYGAVAPVDGRIGTETMPGVFAQVGMEYLHDHAYGGEAFELFAKISEKNHSHSTLNPLAAYSKAMSLEHIMNDVMIAYPNTRPMCSANCDGAAAAVVTSGEKLKTLSLEQQRRAVKVSASILTTDPWEEACQVLPDVNTLTRNAAKQAYEQAGVGPDDLDLVELHDCFATAELVHYDNLMLCEPGGAVDFFESGASWRTGGTPVNVSGGLQSKGHPISATGIANIWEVCQHVRGECGDRQIEGAKVGLAHVIGLGSACGVHILEKSGLAA
jgi:acetyl-CoA acyltransferase